MVKRRSDSRTAGPGCPISFALSIFGDRWTLLVLRDLILRRRQRYKELLAAEEGIATNILADRLRRLEDKGLIVRDVDERDGRQFIYRPTRVAVDLIPMLVEIVVWGVRNNPASNMPSDFVRRFEEDRDALIASLVNGLDVADA